VEKVSDLIFKSLNQQPQALPGLDRPMFLLDGTSILLVHSKDLAKVYPPASNQYGVLYWPVMRVAAAHDVVSGLATRPAWGLMFGEQATSERGLNKTIICRLPPKCGVMGDRNYGVSDDVSCQEPGSPLYISPQRTASQEVERRDNANCRTDKQIRCSPAGKISATIRRFPLTLLSTVA
jgi:hypothetical protein